LSNQKAYKPNSRAARNATHNATIQLRQLLKPRVML